MTTARSVVRSVLTGLLKPLFSLPIRRRAERSVLLVCSSELTADYLAEAWTILKAEPRLRFRLLMPAVQENPGQFERIRAKLPLPEIRSFWAHIVRWDLIVVADHTNAPLIDKARCPTIRLSHGFPGKSWRGKPYAFGDKAYTSDGHIRYTRVFVPSEAARELAESIDAAFRGVVAVVGSPGDDRMLAELGRRDEHRKRLGFQPNDIVVFVTSTWGPHSLFSRMGDVILERARELKDEFRFILSAHPADYRQTDAGGRVWGEYLREQKKYGFAVREPCEDWVPYMVACDIILADHTSLAIHGALLGRAMAYIPIPLEAAARDTIIQQLAEISPRVQEDGLNLREALLKARDDYPFDRLERLAVQMNSCPGRAADRIRNETWKLLGLPPGHDSKT